LGAAVVAPSAAGAFVGESSVLNAGKTALTGPAKTILTNPTFLPETAAGAEALGGAAGADSALAPALSAGAIPFMGAVAAFTAGTVVGSEICSLFGMEGCWYFGSDGVKDPAAPGAGKWQVNSGAYAYLPFGSYYYAVTGSTAFEASFKGYFGVPAECSGAAAVPIGTTAMIEREAGSVFCSGGGGGSVHKGIATRSAFTNRHFRHQADDPAVENKSFTPSAKWEEELVKGIKGHTGDAQAKLGEQIASKIEGSGVKGPYTTYVSVPSCSGESWVECKADLEELQLVPERSKLTWETADIELAPDTVTKLAPVPSTEVETKSKVVVTTNPAEAEMPLLVPDIGAGETYADYIAKLAPAWVPTQRELSPEFTDPHKGPGDVTRTAPEPGTRADPATTPAIDVFNNPTDAPPAAGTWSAPAIPSIDLTPLSGVSIGCNSFPFGVFCWVAAGLTSWGAEGECPSFDVPFTSEIRSSTADLTFDTCTFEPAMEIIRPMLVILSFFGVAWLLSASAMGLGGGASADD
jgi:hypothetical protein